MRLTTLFKEFFENERTSAIVLIGCSLISLFLANSPLADTYLGLWKIQFANHPIDHWVNDGLMAIFFLLIGLELEREIYKGELSNFKDALLPIFAAIGGMLAPALIYLAFNYNTPTQDGYGIPMATDIAFALGLLSILGKKVPISLKVFLTALAVIDDLGAILVIAIFYTKSLSFLNLGISIGIFVVLLIFNRLKVKILSPYLILGFFMWYFMLKSGVHATISGVLLAFAIPFGNGAKNTISYKLQHFLHKPVAFIILPIFALANTSITLNSELSDILTHNYSYGIIFGLMFGKPIGIFLFTLLVVKTGLSKLPNDLNWKIILSTGFLAGIGFTMSIFITLLAFDDLIVVNNSKWSTLITSMFSGFIGLVLLNYFLHPKRRKKKLEKT